MNKSMDKRVYGILGISSLMSNWNADFSGYPKTLSNGKIFGSDKALKYPMKKMWDSEGKSVVYIKSMRFNSKDSSPTVLIPRTLKERYEYVFKNDDLKDSKKIDTKKVLTNLMSAVDVKNFGATFAESGCNISITGAVQIGQGFNKYENSVAEEQAILSPFRDGSNEKNKEGNEAKNSTLGSKITSNEAHYFYPFVINPLAYKELIELDVTEGYTQEDYLNFKRTALVSATSFATNSKVGCENEFAVFVETEQDVYLPNLSEYVNFQKTDDKNIIELKFNDILLGVKDRIKSVEIYYNPHTTKLEGNVDNAKYYNIITQQEV